MIGMGSDVDAESKNDMIVIGYNLIGGAVGYAYVGNSSQYVTLNFNSSGQNWANTSDIRIKRDVVDTDLGLEFINKLRPIKYKDIAPAEWPEKIKPKELREEDYIPCEDVIDGLIAQDVLQAAKELGTTFSGWEGKEEDDTERQMLQYASFVTPLIKAMQELSTEVTELKKEIEELKK